MQDPMIQLPTPVQFLLSSLHTAGFSACAVGGCIRDVLLGLVPHDWDICTSALPEQMQAVFSDQHLIETGLKHGTLTVALNHVPYEITTYRTDGMYTDHRHPDSVTFVGDLREDLSRRDFTINAMAWSDRDGLVDLFGGQADLRHRLIRCVGEPEQRFGEDALRILRALRFASVYDFLIDPVTASALRKLSPSLSQVAPERVRDELMRLLCGPGAGRILRSYPDVISRFLPEITPMIGYDQNNHHHLYTLWEHTVRAVENIPPDPVLRLTMLLHDTGKPEVRTDDPAGESHYRGHQAASARIAEKVLYRLRFDRKTRDRVLLLVEHHDIPLRNEQGAVNTDNRFLLRLLNRFGEENLRALFLIHRSDRISTGYSTLEKEERRFQERMRALDRLLSSRPCFTLKDLAVHGGDLIACGLKGPAVGRSLNFLLDAVMDAKVQNDKKALLEYLSERIPAPLDSSSALS